MHGNMASYYLTGNIVPNLELITWMCELHDGEETWTVAYNGYGHRPRDLYDNAAKVKLSSPDYGPKF